MPQTQSRILDATGKPFQITLQREVKPTATVKTAAAYMQALYGMEMPAMYRAQDPYSNHPWIYAACTSIAVNISQAPFMIYSETQDTLDQRYLRCKRAGIPFHGPKAGRERTAVMRHLAKSPSRRAMGLKGLEPVVEHPLMVALNKPNSVMTGAMLWQATVLWMLLRGKCVWVMFGEGGSPRAPGTPPAEIWPLPPDLFKPLWTGNQITGYRFATPKGIGKSASPIDLDISEVVEFKFFNPNVEKYHEGFAPVVAAAQAVALDALAAEANKAVIANGNDPGGLLIDEHGSYEDDDSEDTLRKKWEQRHAGPHNRRRVAILTGGLKYISTAMTNQEMEFSELSRKDRDEILAVIGVPKTMVGLTETVNRATAITQKRLFWEERAIPIVRTIEDVMDSTLLYTETDQIVGAFDLSQIEALREGLSEQVATAVAMTAPGLHTPPAVAYETVGLDVPDYPGRDVALLTPGLSTIEPILSGETLQSPENAPGGVAPGQDEDEDEDEDEDGREGEKRFYAAPPSMTRRRRQDKHDTWSKLIRRVQEPGEARFSRSWKQYINEQREANLKKFDRVMRDLGLKSFRLVKADGNFPVDLVLPELITMQKALRGKVRPIYAGIMEDVLDFTVKEIGGIAVFEMDDPVIQSALDDREDILVGKAPPTIQKSIRESIRVGMEKGETIQEMRDRVARVYNVSASSAKSLTVARTESAGFVNEARDRMFEAQGLDKLEWTTAQDEAVRESHVVYGAAGQKPMGFNYLELVGQEGDGVLEYPSDSRAPGREVINCRCVHIPVL